MEKITEMAEIPEENLMLARESTTGNHMGKKEEREKKNH